MADVKAAADMRVLVTGSAGHLGEGLVRTLRNRQIDVVGLDRLASPFTDHVGSLQDRDLVHTSLRGIDRVVHVASLHKPHLATHSPQAFLDTNVRGTLTLLEAAVATGVAGVVFSSTTSVFGGALRPDPGQPAVWVDEDLAPIPRNVYGVTKRAAEDLCELYARTRGLPCVVLRTSRFFPEADDDAAVRAQYDDLNLKVNEFLHRRVELADAVDAHVLAAERAASIGFGRYVVSATSPFERGQVTPLRTDAAAVVRALFPAVDDIYRRRRWTLPARIDRVYVNRRARRDLGWTPRHDFPSILDALGRDDDVFSPLTAAVGSKGYHDRAFDDGPYPVEPGRK